MRLRNTLALLVSLLGAFGSGWAYLRSASTPMPSRTFVQQGASKTRGAIVLLPGFGDGPDTFEERGFVAALKRAAPDYDIVAADAHFGYYRKRSLIDRLDRDVVAPLRNAGYRELWLVGASMGGHGAVARSSARHSSLHASSHCRATTTGRCGPRPSKASRRARSRSKTARWPHA
jgi:hypothetical protein